MLAEERLRSGDDLVWTGGQGEADAGFVIGLNRGRDVERGDLDVFRPVAALPIIPTGVNRAADDGVFGNLLAMAVLEDQYRRGKFR